MKTKTELEIISTFNEPLLMAFRCMILGINVQLNNAGIEKAKRECKTPISENLFVRSIDENESIELVDVAGTILNGFTAHLLKLKQ